MTNTEKSTINDLAWEFIEEGVHIDTGAIVFYLVASGVKVSESSILHLQHRLRVEHAKRGQWGQVRL